MLRVEQISAQCLGDVHALLIVEGAAVEQPVDAEHGRLRHSQPLFDGTAVLLHECNLTALVSLLLVDSQPSGEYVDFSRVLLHLYAQ